MPLAGWWVRVGDSELARVRKTRVSGCTSHPGQSQPSPSTCLGTVSSLAKSFRPKCVREKGLHEGHRQCPGLWGSWPTELLPPPAPASLGVALPCGLCSGAPQMSFLSQAGVTPQQQTAAHPVKAKQYIHSFFHFNQFDKIFIEHFLLLGPLVGTGQREKWISSLTALQFSWGDSQWDTK